MLEIFAALGVVAVEALLRIGQGWSVLYEYGLRLRAPRGDVLAKAPNPPELLHRLGFNTTPQHPPRTPISLLP